MLPNFAQYLTPPAESVLFEIRQEFGGLFLRLLDVIAVYNTDFDIVELVAAEEKSVLNYGIHIERLLPSLDF
jgi:hypothetical protein